VLGALGRRIEGEGDGYFFSDELFVSLADANTRGATRVHLAFQAADRETVDRFHAAALAAGGSDHGAPGLRPYHADYYGAFVIDPDGNNIEAVFHGPSRRSAKSVLITF
jgi:predicted lactoylglutathione lyase